MFRRILLPVDGSTFAEHALPYAVHAARVSGAELILALVHTRGVPATTDMMLRDELDRWETEHVEKEAGYLNALAARAMAESGLDVRPELLNGDVVPALEREVKLRQVDLVVMTTHGRAGLERAWLGSVADALVRHVDVPVLLVRPADGEPVGRGGRDSYRHLLIALDGSERAERAIAPALALARPDARVTLLRVAAPPAAATSPYLPHAARLNREALDKRQREAEEYLSGQRRLLGETATVVESAVIMAYHPARGILEYAAENDVDLIAVGTHGHSPVTRAITGSVTDKVVRAAQAPVLVC